MYLCICAIVLSSSFFVTTDGGHINWKVLGNYNILYLYGHEAYPYRTPFLERGSPCTTPHGEKAACISILLCPGLVNILLQKNDTTTEYAVRFQCGYDTEPLVCCRFSDYPPGIFDEFTKPTYTVPSNFDVLDIENSFPLEELPEAKECGRNTETNKILTGEITDIKEFPWLVALEYKSKITGENVGVRCGGSIINKKFILTAAQCLLDREFALITVRVGDWKLSSNPDCDDTIANYECNGQFKTFKIAEFIPHPFYNKRNGNNDIALIKIAGELKYNDYIQPICLPPPQLPSPRFDTLLVATGFETRTRTTSDDVKLKQVIQMLSNYVCDKTFQNRQIGPNQICATSKTNKISHQGDPGGLLMRTYKLNDDQETRWYQEGVTSWDYACERPGEPMVYTRVSRYIRWIANVIRKDKLKIV